MASITKILTDVFNWIHTIVPNYGVDIILFTLLLKIVLLPFNIWQTKSTVKTQLVQPKLKEIQNKYKNDPKKLQEAQLALYKNEGVNPLGGCLPLLIQWPILISIFYVFRGHTFGEAVFLGIHLNKLLSQQSVFGLSVALISGLTTYLSTWLLTPKTQEPNPMMSKNTNLIMSGFFAWVTYTVSGGLAIYWIVNNVLQMAIQYLLNKSIYKQMEVSAQR